MILKLSPEVAAAVARFLTVKEVQRILLLCVEAQVSCWASGDVWKSRTIQEFSETQFISLSDPPLIPAEAFGCEDFYKFTDLCCGYAWRRLLISFREESISVDDLSNEAKLLRNRISARVNPLTLQETLCVWRLSGAFSAHFFASLVVDKWLTLASLVADPPCPHDNRFTKLHSLLPSFESLYLAYNSNLHGMNGTCLKRRMEEVGLSAQPCLFVVQTGTLECVAAWLERGWVNSTTERITLFSHLGVWTCKLHKPEGRMLDPVWYSDGRLSIGDRAIELDSDFARVSLRACSLPFGLHHCLTNGLSFFEVHSVRCIQIWLPWWSGSPNKNPAISGQRRISRRLSGASSLDPRVSRLLNNETSAALLKFLQDGIAHQSLEDEGYWDEQSEEEERVVDRSRVVEVVSKKEQRLREAKYFLGFTPQAENYFDQE